MYNLLVSGSADSWAGEPYELELSRCVREYTNDDLSEKYGSLGYAEVQKLQRLPCIFAYEAGLKKDPKFGLIEQIVQRQRVVRIRYKIIEIEPFLTAEVLEELALDLDIGKWELNRTHWAVKDVNLAKEIRDNVSISLPIWAGDTGRTIDIAKHNFLVGLSFPGEVRPQVEEIARELEGALGPNAYFYDNNYVAQLAQPSLDVLLQDIYKNRSALIVVFLSGNYDKKEWCGIEFRAIRDIIMGRDNKRIMYIRTDDGPVDGVLKTDGFVDARKYSAKEIAGFINERVSLLQAD